MSEQEKLASPPPQQQTAEGQPGKSPSPGGDVSVEEDMEEGLFNVIKINNKFENIILIYSY